MLGRWFRGLRRAGDEDGAGGWRAAPGDDDDERAGRRRLLGLAAGGGAAAAGTLLGVALGRATSGQQEASELTGLIHDSGGQVYNVKVFGAQGDGGHDDREAIQTAVDRAEAGGGGIVYLPHGTYLISTDVQLKSNVSLVGAGRAASIIKPRPGFVSSLEALVTVGPGVVDCRISGLTIDANNVRRTSLIRMNGAERVVVEDVALLNWARDGEQQCRGVFILSSGGSPDRPSRDVVIRDFYMKTNNTFGPGALYTGSHFVPGTSTVFGEGGIGVTFADGLIDLSGIDHNEPYSDFC